MVASTIGALRVVLGLDSANFSTGAKKAENRAEQLGVKIGRSMRGASKEVGEFTKTFLGLATVAGGAAIGALAAKSLDYASSLGEVAQQLGITTKDLQEYRYAATQVGISQEEMDKGLAKLTVSMGQAREGVAKPVAAFKELSGLLGKDILKNARTAGDAIPLVADALAKVQDPARRAALEVALFGKTGQKLDTLLAGGSGAVNELRDAARSLGLVLSDKQIQDADRTADKLSELKQVLEANIAGQVADNATAIYNLASGLAQLTSEVIKFLASNPQAALGLVGALLGGRAGGLPGAAAGAFAGYVAGDRFSQSASDSNSDLKYRRDQFRAAIKNRADRRKAANSNSLFSVRQTQGQGSARVGTAEEVIKQGNLYLKAIKAAKVTKIKSAVGGAGAGVTDAEKSAGASAAKKAAADSAKRAREAERASEEAARNERQFHQDLSRAQQEQLNAQLDLTANQTERVNIQQTLLDNDRDTRIQAIATDKDLTAEQKRQLTVAEEQTYLLRARLLHQRDQEELAAQALANARADNDNQQDILGAQADLARTSKERGRIELQILDLQFKQLKAEQQTLLDDATRRGDKDAARNAQNRLSTLGTLEGFAKTQSARSNQGPMASYLDGIPKSADQVNEALERIQVDGISSLIDGLSDLEGGFEGLADTVKDVSAQIVRSLVKIAIQKGFEALVNAVSKKSGDGSLAGARASGGPVIGGKSYLVGERGPEIFRAPGSGNIVANDDIGGGRRSISFDLRGAVMTADLLSQMNSIAFDSAGVVVGQNNRTVSRRGRQRLG